MSTNENLEAAFAGESQANRKYTAFARRADEEGCYVCQVCGNTVENEAPDTCPICQSARKLFKKID